MSNIFKNTLLILSISSLYCYSGNSLADNGSGGKYTVKAKVLGIVSRVKKTSNFTINRNITSTLTTLGAVNDSSVQASIPYNTQNSTSIGSGLGFEISGNYFLTDNIAIEAAASLLSRKIKISGIGTSNLDPKPYAYTISSKSNLIPLALILQYHIAPYGKISPYVGAGYHYTVASSSGGAKISSSNGPVAQIGFDGWVNDNAFVNFEVKKYLMENKIGFNIPTAGGNLVIPTEKIKINPTIVSLGMGYRF
jgi:outer membrane protein